MPAPTPQDEPTDAVIDADLRSDGFVLTDEYGVTGLRAAYLIGRVRAEAELSEARAAITKVEALLAPRTPGDQALPHRNEARNLTVAEVRAALRTQSEHAG